MFALLDLFGLIFAVYDFNVSQTQAEESSVAQAEIKDEIKAVGEAVAEVTVANEPAEAKPRFVPIEAAFSETDYTSDRVTFDKAFITDSNLNFSGTASYETANWLKANDPRAVQDFFVATFSVTSAAGRNYVQIAPYIVIQVIEAKPFGDDYAFMDVGEYGGSASVREFNGNVGPELGLQFIPLVDTYSGEIRRDVDFFTLAPREPEEFVLWFSTRPGYRYVVRAGLHYKFDGEHSIHWVSRPFVTGSPAEKHVVHQWDGTFQETTDWYWDTEALQGFDNDVENQAKLAESGKVFRPSQIPDFALRLN